MPYLRQFMQRSAVRACRARPRMRVAGFSLCMVLLGTACTFVANSQAPPNQRSAATRMLERAGQRVAIAAEQGQGSREFDLHWQSAAAAPPPGGVSQAVGGAQPGAVANRLQVLRQRRRNDDVPRQRSDEIGPGQLLVVALDRQGTVRFTRIMNDPRVVIGEVADETGQLHRTDVPLAAVDIEVAVPASVDVGEFRIYQPVAGVGSTMELQPVPGAATSVVQ